MIFGWEIKNRCAKEILIEIWLSRTNLFLLTELDIFFEHVRKSFLELQGNALSHNSNTIHGINKRLHRRIKDTANQHFHFIHLPQGKTDED